MPRSAIAAACDATVPAVCPTFGATTTAGVLLDGEKPAGRNNRPCDLMPSLKNCTSRAATPGGRSVDGLADGPALPLPCRMNGGSAATFVADERYFRNQSAARFEPISNPAFEYAWKWVSAGSTIACAGTPRLL